MLKGKKIIVAVTGSIAAYKTVYLVRLLVGEGADVRVIMTPAARDFITPLTLSTLSRNPVVCEPFDSVSGTWHSHVELGLWADAMLVAPLTANTLAKMAYGIADNFVTTVYLSARCPVFFAPAMDSDMYSHPTTIENVRKLQGLGHILIEPQVGELASGLSGKGRMEEPEKIISKISEFFMKKEEFKGKKVLVTGGPTHEAIDAVRFIGNHATGQMGLALALEAAWRGADVALVMGPSPLASPHPRIRRYDVVSAEEMFRECHRLFPEMDMTIMAAAVADFTPAAPQTVKIKKRTGMPEIKLKPTTDILRELGKIKKKNQLLIGFALETENEAGLALEKLREKNLDLIVLNSLRDAGAGFGYETNKVTLINKKGQQKPFPLKKKTEVAGDILDAIAQIAGIKPAAPPKS